MTKTEKAIIKAWTADDKVYPVVVEFEDLGIQREFELDGIHFEWVRYIEVINTVKLSKNYTALDEDIKAGLESYLGVENLKLIY